MAQPGIQTQIGSLGPQDVFIRCDPDKSFFVGKTCRHTNFALGEVYNTFEATANFNMNGLKCKLQRAGDLFGPQFFHAIFPHLDYTAAPASYDQATEFGYYVNSVMSALIRNHHVEIGSVQTGGYWTSRMLEVFHQMAALPEKLPYEMSGFALTPQELGLRSLYDMEYYQMLPQSYFRSWDQLLPAVALSEHETYVIVDTPPQTDLIMTFNTNPLTPPNFTYAQNLIRFDILSHYVYLDEAERQMFADAVHELLIEDVQSSSYQQHAATAPTERLQVKFNNPIKCLLWWMQQDSLITAPNHDTFNFGGPFWSFLTDLLAPAPPDSLHSHQIDPFATFQIFTNGQPRTPIHNANYARLIQPYLYGRRIPLLFIYLYSYALSPFAKFPSGVINGSKLDTHYIDLTFPALATQQWAGKMYAMAVALNVLRVANGMGGTLFG